MQNMLQVQKAAKLPGGIRNKLRNGVAALFAEDLRESDLAVAGFSCTMTPSLYNFRLTTLLCAAMLHFPESLV